MHSFFIFVPDFTPWQQHRIYSACRAYMSVLDPGFETEALHLDGQHVGWTFFLTTDEARQRLIVFFTGLIGRGAEEQPYGDPAKHCEYDAAAALERLRGMTR